MRSDDRVHEDDVDRADDGRGSESTRQERCTADGANDERLQQSALRVSPDDGMGQEDRQHRPEEENREDREPEERRAEEHLRVDERVLGAVADGLGRVGIDRLVRLVDAESVQPEEGDGEDEDDREDAAADALPHRIARDDHRAPQVVSPSTASR